MTPRLNPAKLPTDMFWKPTAFPADKPAENVFRLNARTDILPTLFPAKAAIRSQLPENRAVKFAESVIANLHRENALQLMKQHYHVKRWLNLL